MNKDLEDHKLVAESMKWDDLAGTIIDIETEMLELKDLMTKRELNKYIKALKIYEQAKIDLIKKVKDKILHSSSPVLYGYISDWNDEEEDY